MKKTSLFTAVWLICICSAAFAGSGPDFREGQWEITVEVEMPGMGMKLPPNSYKQCMTKNTPVPIKYAPGQTCEMKDMKTKGNTMTWNLKCTNQGGTMTGRGEVTYQKESMQGTMSMEGQGMQMNSKISGRRIGPCQ
jgi:hypothetical protein